MNIMTVYERALEAIEDLPDSEHGVQGNVATFTDGKGGPKCAARDSNEKDDGEIDDVSAYGAPI